MTVSLPISGGGRDSSKSPFFSQSRSHRHQPSACGARCLGRRAGSSIGRRPSGPRPSSPPWYATPTISCVRNAHLPRSPANPLPATPRERSHPQRVALSQRLARGDLAAAAEVGPTSTTRVPRVNLNMQHWMVRSARVPAARQRVWRLSTSLSAPVLSFCD